jgi:HD-GYP domain-containing protein (c-di-GMP phosphodiesterase class II)
LARILQIADVYDALTSERPYKRAYSHTETLEILQQEAAKGWRDCALVSLFEEMCGRAANGKPSMPAPGNWPNATPMQISLHNMSRALLKDKP